MRKYDEEGGSKYLGILEADGVKYEKMKSQIKKQYIRRVRNILKSKLSGANNSRAVSIIRYEAAIICSTKMELEELDGKTRKLIRMYGAHQMLIDVTCRNVRNE